MSMQANLYMSCKAETVPDLSYAPYSSMAKLAGLSTKDKQLKSRKTSGKDSVQSSGPVKRSSSAPAETSVEEATWSPSKKRKVEKFERTKTRNPIKDFVTACNQKCSVVLLPNSIFGDERSDYIAFRLQNLYSQLIEKQENDNRFTRINETLDYIYKADTATDDAFAAKARLACVNRVLQICLKYGDAKQRQFILEKIKGTFVQMASTDSGSYLCRKALKYGAPESQRELVRLLLEAKSNDIYFSKFASRVISTALALPPPFDAGAARRYVLQRLGLPPVVAMTLPAPPPHDGLALTHAFSKTDDRGRRRIQEYLLRNITRAVDKELVSRDHFHHLMQVYANTLSVESEALKSLFETLKDCLPLLLSSKSGCDCICKVLAVATAKDRKTFFAQQLRDAQIAPVDIATNGISYIVYVYALSHVDDTRLLRECILSPVFGIDSRTGALLKDKTFGSGAIGNIANVVRDKVSRKLCLMLLTQDAAKYLTREEVKVFVAPSPTSKKDPEKRRQELLTILLPGLKALFLEELGSADVNFVERWLQDRDARDILVEYLGAAADDAAEVTDGLIRKILAADSKKIFDDQTAHRTLIKLLRIKSQVAQGDAVTMIRGSDGKSLYEVLLSHCTNHVAAVLEGRGVFVIVELLNIAETNADLQEFFSKDLEKLKMKCLKSLKAMKTELPGVKILKSKLCG